MPGAQALWLLEEVAGARPEAFLIGREFAHVHPPYDGSMHMMLPSEAVEQLLEKGWGEPHPMARRGLIPPTAVMVYAPRDVAEVETILQIIAASYHSLVAAKIRPRKPQHGPLDEPAAPHHLEAPTTCSVRGGEVESLQLATAAGRNLP